MNINGISKRPKIKITLKLWKNGEKVKTYHSAKIRRIIAKVKADKFLKAYLKVYYGKAITNSGKIEKITNSGTYESQDDLIKALSAFTEKSLLEDTAKWIQDSSAVSNRHKILLTGSVRTG